MNKRMMGSCYERMAAAYLKENYGYKILEMNYKCRFGEIDIIASVKLILSLWMGILSSLSK